MTEAEFVQQQRTIEGLLKRSKELIAEAVELERRALEWRIDLLNAAQQEPWFGEAND